MDSAGRLEAPTFAGRSRREVAALSVFVAAVAIEIAVFGLPLTPERFLLAPLAAAIVLKRTRPYFRPQIRIEEALFRGHLPSVELPHWLWTGHLRFYDHVIIVFSSIHFIVPPALAFFFWLTDMLLFRRFVRTYLALS